MTIPSCPTDLLCVTSHASCILLLIDSLLAFLPVCSPRRKTPERSQNCFFVIFLHLPEYTKSKKLTHSYNRLTLLRRHSWHLSILCVPPLLLGDPPFPRHVPVSE